VPPSASRSYEDRPVTGPRGVVSPVRFERTLPTSSRWCLLPLGYEDMEPPGGLEPPAFPKRGPPRTRTAHLLLARQALSQMS
jgi:hypothetical protein